MNVLLTLAVPLILAAVGICAVFGKADIFSALTRGAAEGLVTVKDMFPALVVLFPAVYMLRASGAIDALAAFLAAGALACRHTRQDRAACAPASDQRRSGDGGCG